MRLTEEVTIYLYSEPTDMRQSFSGLAGIVNNQMNRKATDGCVYAFFNKRRNLVKLLWYEVAPAAGYSIWMHRLDRGCYNRHQCKDDGAISLEALLGILNTIIVKKSVSY